MRQFDLHGINALGQCRIGRAIRNVGSVPTLENPDRRFGVGRRSQLFKRLRASAAAARLLALCNKGYGSVQTNGEHVFWRFKRRICAVMGDVGTVAAKAGGDGFGRLRMQANFTRQGEKFQCHFQINRLRRHAFGYTRTRRFLVVSKLDIGPKTPSLEGDHFAAFRINPQLARFSPRVCVIGSELASELALRVIGAADEGAKSSELQI